MTTFLGIDDDLMDMIENPVELEAAPAGEYTIELKGFRTNEEGSIDLTDRNGGKYIMPEFEIVDHPDEAKFKTFSEFIGFPRADMPAKQKQSRANKIAYFSRAFNINLKDFDSEDYIGNRAEVLLSWKDDPEYGAQNSIQKFLRPA